MDDTVATVAVTAPAPTLQNGQSMQLSAVARNAAGEALAGKTFTWTSSSEAVATVASDGTVTGRSAGPVTITATAEGKSGTIDITITPVPVASVSVSPDSIALFVGETQQLAAVARDASGAVLTGRAVAWSSADSAVAAVSPAGLVTARAPGSVLVTATVEGRQGTARIVVRRTTGTLSVAVVTEGDLLDPDGYEILGNGQLLGRVGINGTLRVEEAAPGAYTISLRGASLYCALTGAGERSVTVSADATTGVEFRLQCSRNGIAYQVHDGSVSSLFVHFPGRDPVLLVRGVSSSRVRWSPDGRRIFYAGVPSAGASLAVRSIDLDSLAVVTVVASGLHPDPSPDGSHVAYVVGRNVRTASVDGSGQTTVWASPSTSIVGGMPVWSPDGSRIAFVKTDFSAIGSGAQIIIINRDGTGERVLRTLRSRPYLHIDWSPDGSRIVYADQGEGGGAWAVYTADVSTGEEALVIDATGTDYQHPEYLNDGRIGFVSQPHGESTTRVWTINANGTGLMERVIPGTTTASVPAWQ